MNVAAEMPRSLHTRLGPRARQALWALTFATLAAAIIAYASIPTGAPSAAGVVPADGRLVVEQPVAGARAIVAARPQTLQLIVAVHRQKGWFGLRVADTPADGIAWASTAGAHAVPALSAVFGRADGVSVRVRWADGVVQTALVQSDGVFLASRTGSARSLAVTILDAKGATVREVPGP